MSAIRLALILGILLGTVPGAVPAVADRPEVLLLLSDQTDFYQECSASAQSVLEQGRTEVRLAAAFDAESQGSYRVIVAVGGRAFTAAAAARSTSTPLVAALLPRSTFEEVMEGRGKSSRPVTAVYLDQPPGRHLALIRALFPDHVIIASVIGPNSAWDWQVVQKLAADDPSIVLNGSRVTSEQQIYAAMTEVLPNAVVFLALPDSVVFNARTAQNVLATTYRYHVPVVAFSPRYVEAGALAAAYSTAAQIGRQAAAIAAGVLEGKPLPPPEAAREFSVAVNPKVARAFNIEVDPGTALHDRVRDLEGRQ